ncbi:DNRLRE domain-containing protein [Streptacidiphilus monticola]
MWDSSAPTTTTVKTAALSLDAVTSGGTGDSISSGGSSAEGPGQGATVAPVTLSASGTGLTLTPDQSLLTASDTAFPVYIDPATVTDMTKNYTQVWQGCPTASSGWNTEEGNGTEAGEGIGYIQPGWGSNCGAGAEESFYTMDLSKIPHGSTVTDATLTLTQTYGADHGCTQWPVTLTVTNPIYPPPPASSNPTTWNNRPQAAPGIAAFSQKKWMYSVDATTSCGTSASSQITFQLATQVNAVQGGTLTFGLTGDESTSSTNYGHMRFANNPSIATKYDLPPSSTRAASTPILPQSPSTPRAP